MNWVVYLFGTGAAFFVGVGFVVVSIVAFSLARAGWPTVVATLVAVVGLAFVTLSATPLPYWLYALAGVVTVPWLAGERSRRGWPARCRRPLRWGVAAVWLVAAAVEAPYYVTPAVAAAGRPTLYVIGDSIAAGVGGREETWPRILARTGPMEVVDLSRAGADVRTVGGQADRLPADGGLVLVEIGGNDLLGITSAADFERGLDHLLGRVVVPGRTVVMFELPLPPFCNDYGLAQRRLAAKHGVALIPRRVLMAVLTGDAATSDSLHLTAAGHQRMADAVWAVIRPAYEG
jgi:acyl-CoA thioesterase-1